MTLMDGFGGVFGGGRVMDTVKRGRGISRCCLTSAGRVPERGGGLGESLVYNRVHVFGQVDR